MTGDYAVRLASPSDTTVIGAIFNECLPAEWNQSALAAALQNPQYGFFVAYAETSGGEMAFGAAAATLVADECCLISIAVRPAFRRRGAADRLLAAAEELALSHGCAHVFLEVRAGNVAAQALYERRTYRPTGRRPAFYAHPTEDALLYTKTLGEPVDA